jgi:dipeptidyl aminopeptidase/acylaminoacyl peptidase
VIFANKTDAAVELFWINQQGKRKSYGRVAAGGTRDMSTYAGHVWLVADANGETLAVVEARADALELVIDGKSRPAAPTKTQPRDTSPDGRWQVRFEKNQVALRDQTTSDTTLLTTDGTAAQPYRGSVAWSPDGQSFVVLAVKDAPVRKVTVIESSPADQTQPKTHTFDYAKPGDELPRPRPVLFRLADRQPVRIADELFPNPFTPGGTLDIRWSPRSDEFFFDYNQRGHQLWRILAVNAQTGAVRTVIEEKARTFIDYTNKTWRHWLDDTRELLWMSERDSWCHLWLYDTATGAVKNQVTRGEWVVRKVERVDAKKRQVWFLASGLRAGEDPYHRHLCRVNFDGSGFVQLTAGDGDHAIALSPDARFFTDTWSRADHPPVFELRHSDDGKLICELERADASALLATGWTMPERLVAKGRDGVTEIHGVLIKPSHFDPAKKYPVLEEVYAGPHGAFSPKKFFTLPRQHALAELGFIVVQADGMGTNHRGKAFHDLAWKNLQDAGFPDRIAWIKAAAVTRPWMDLTRVGIYGGSAGGQNAMRALLDHAFFSGPPSPTAAATTTAWTRSGGTSSGSAGRWTSPTCAPQMWWMPRSCAVR